MKRRQFIAGIVAAPFGLLCPVPGQAATSRSMDIMTYPEWLELPKIWTRPFEEMEIGKEYRGWKYQIPSDDGGYLKGVRRADLWTRWDDLNLHRRQVILTAVLDPEDVA